MFAPDTLVTVLKAVAEPTRLRILWLLASGELNVKDLTGILGQSQPRISRHLKLLAEAGLVERAPEGSWVYFHLPQRSDAERLVRQLIATLDSKDPILLRDRARAATVKGAREATAQRYFEKQAANWDRIRGLHVAEADVEAAILDAIGPGRIDTLVDIGTGTGRMLELTAGCYRRGLGLDLNTAMLAYARAKLDRAGISHAQIRQGDIYHLPLAEASANVVIMHQVLHFLSDPGRAVCEATRIVAEGGRLIIVDFAPHDLDFLRETHAHERLGFAAATVNQWLDEARLSVVETRQLAPTRAAPEEQLTVSIWVAERRAALADNAPANRANLERTV